MDTSIRIRSLADFVTTLPYELGYHPAASLVIVGLRGQQVGVVQRLDLVPPETSPLTAELVARMSVCLTALRRVDASEVIVFGFEDVPGQSWPMFRATAELLEPTEIAVHSAAVIRDGRCWVLDSLERAAAPIGPGEALPDPDRVPAVADFVALGRAPLEGRNELARLVGGMDGPQVEHTARLLESRLRRVPAGPSRGPRPGHVLALTRVLQSGRTGSGPEPKDVATLAWTMLDRPWRDGVIAALCPGSLALEALPVRVARAVHGLDLPGTADSRLQAWFAACRMLPEATGPTGSAGAAMLTVAAHLAWWSGDGALATDAIERALRLDPAHRLARLLSRICTEGIPPRSWPLPA